MERKNSIERLILLSNNIRFSKSKKIKEKLMLLSDDEKIKGLNQLNNDSDKIEIIKTLQEDDKKIETLELLSSDSDKVEIIKTLQEDDKKIEALELLSSDDDKEEIIETLQKGDKKIKALGKLNDHYEKTRKILARLLENSRNNLKEFLLEKDKTYTKIGLDPKMTVGIEIETENGIRPNVNTLVIRKLKKIFKRQIGEKVIGWETKPDFSLPDGGVEVTSPVLTDSEENVEEIYMTCSLLQKCETIPTEHCGGHVHIGADYLKSIDAYINLFEIWGNAEQIIYKISNEVGTIPRTGIKKYAEPISPKLKNAIEKGSINLDNEEDLDKFIKDIQKVQRFKYSGLNLLNINNGKNTIEFRIPNGTINPDTWIENIRMYGRIVQMSQKLAEIEKKTEKTEEDKRLLYLKECLKEEIPEQEKLEILLELLFSKEEKKVYRDRYISSTKILKRIEDDDNPLKAVEFSRVDFKRKHNLEEYHDIAIKNRIEAINEITKETVQSIKTENKLEKVDNENMEEMDG